MQYKLLTAALLSSIVLASPSEKQKRQNPDAFASAAAALVSAYIPASVLPGLDAAVASAANAAGVTGDGAAIFNSAILAPTPPAFLTAVGSQYQANIMSLEAAIASLRGGAASAGGAAATNAAGSAQLSSLAAQASSNVVVAGTSASAAAGSSITGAISSAAAAGSSVAASASSASAAASSKAASASNAATSAASSAASAASASATKASGASPSLAPGIMGIMAVLGLAAAL